MDAQRVSEYFYSYYLCIFKKHSSTWCFQPSYYAESRTYPSMLCAHREQCLSAPAWTINALLTKLVRSGGWILAKLLLLFFLFAFLWTETKSRSIKTQKERTRSISSHLERTNLVNKGFIIWPRKAHLARSRRQPYDKHGNFMEPGKSI